MRILILVPEAWSVFLNRILKEFNSYELIPSTREDTDLFSLDQTKAFIEKPDIIINMQQWLAEYTNNTKRFDFIMNNLKINMNILESCVPAPNIKLLIW